jgi:hypothetical protein
MKINFHPDFGEFSQAEQDRRTINIFLHPQLII